MNARYQEYLKSGEKLTFNILPKATPRPRVGKFGAYYPKEYQIYKDTLRYLAKSICKNHFEGALSLEIIFYMQIPKATSKKRYSELIGSYHISKPDCDNLAKGVKDSLEGVAYRNDSQIARLTVTKKYSENPRIEFEICELK